jgi:hypothetical protein
MTTPTNASPDVLITLVHGTWGRGVFPKDRAPDARWSLPRWFDDDHGFPRKLRRALSACSLGAEIVPFKWGGENSIRKRDEAAGELASLLSEQRNRSPHAVRVVIAHSHGGNVALRALHHPTLRGEQDIMMVTLATPFLQVFGTSRRGSFATEACLMAIILAPFAPFFWLHGRLDWHSSFPYSPLILITLLLLLAVALGFIGIKGIERSAGWLNDLAEQTDIRQRGTGTKLLVLRAIDDEASLTLAMGAIVNRASGLAGRATASMMFRVFDVPDLLPKFLRRLFPVAVLMFALALYFLPTFHAAVRGWLAEHQMPYAIAAVQTMIVMAYMALVLTLVASLALTVYGRELALTLLLGCEVNSHSSPDWLHLPRSRETIEIVTLPGSKDPRRQVRRVTYVFPLYMGRRLVRRQTTTVTLPAKRNLRHGIYDHPKCATVIAKWLSRVLAERRNAPPKAS